MGYVPPELLNKDSELTYDGMDFWALGILIFHCLCNKTPFAAPNEYLTFKKIEELNYDLPESLSANAKSIIGAFLNADLKKRLGMNGFDGIKTHKFFESVSSWEWVDMRNVVPPNYPKTPKNSPIHDDDHKRELRGSVYGADDEMNAKVKPLELNKPDMNKNKKWQKFLQSEELIEMGSSVEKSKYLGMGSEKSVLLLTSMKRLLLIDPIKMELRKNGSMSASSIVSCTVTSTQAFELRFVKNKIKFKCTGTKASKWKEA